MPAFEPNVIVTPDSIALYNSRHQLLAELSLNFAIGGKAFHVQSLEETSSGYRGLTEDPSVKVDIRRDENHLCVELIAPPKGGQDVTYFNNSKICATHVHAFIPDINLGTFSSAEEKTFTLTSQAAMRQRLGIREELWMLAPQPHVLALGSQEGEGFSFSIPECLASDALQFILKNKLLKLDFLHYVPGADGGRWPRVYLDLGISSKDDALGRHLGHARALGLVKADKSQPAWWHNPLYCTWGDQCRLGFHGVVKDACLTPERILGWADKIRSFYDGEVNFIIDDGYFLGFGDFRLRPELYPTQQAFKDLIAELKRRKFRVILWYTPFWVGKEALAVKEHPEWLLKKTDGTLLDETGDWKGKYHFDWSHPELRDYQKTLIRKFLTEFDADGFKIDMTYANPPTRDVILHDPKWAAGNLFCKRVIEFIHEEAVSIKSDVFLTANGVESYLQPFISAVRLNDLFDYSNSTAWYRRAELVTKLMPGIAIDVDGWPAGPAKLREYPFVASVFGAPVTYYLDGSDVGDLVFGDVEINRMASVWNVYNHAPVHGDDQVLINADTECFERRDASGKLRALSLVKKVFVSYGVTVKVTVNTSMAVAIPVEGKGLPSAVEQVDRKGLRSPVVFYPEKEQILFFARDSGEGILFYELTF